MIGQATWQSAEKGRRQQEIDDEEIDDEEKALTGIN